MSRLSRLASVISLSVLMAAPCFAAEDSLGDIKPKEPEKTAEAPKTDLYSDLTAMKDQVGALKVMQAAAGASAPPARQKVSLLYQSMDELLLKAKKEKDEIEKEKMIKEGLSKVNAAALAVGAELSAPLEVVKTINNAAARVNNLAGNYRESADFSDTVLERDKDDRDALINNANANNGLNRFDRAFASADRAAQLYKNSEAYASRAMASYGMGHYLQAVEDSRRALALNPNDKTAFSLLKLAEGRVPPSENVDTAKRQAEASVQREYHGMIQQINQVEEKRRQPPAGAAPQAIEKLQASAAKKISEKDYWGALSAADAIVALAPENTQGYYYRAAAHNLLGEYKKAAQDASEALALNPADTSARDARSWALYNLGRYDEAIADANHSLGINPKNAYAYATRAYARDKKGNPTAMMEDLKTAAALNPQFEPAYRDAAAANGPRPGPAFSPVSAPTPAPSPAAAPDRHSRRKSFLTVLVSSLVGGILIAAGLLQIFSSHWTKKISTEIRKAQGDAAATGRRPSSIDASYEIGEAIGQGGMGVVYTAVDRALKRKVAIKVLRPELKSDPRERERFLQEARTVAALHHPSIVDIYSIVEDSEGLFLIFEYVAGKSIDTVLAERKKLSLQEAKAILKPVCMALEFAHRHDVVHRDLKPSNIMITDQGVAKVMDFGIARQAKDSMTKFSVTQTVIGTPHYMAPEQEEGVVRKESDVFSLGACLYEMVTGERPYPAQAATQAKLGARYSKPSRVVENLPGELDALIDGALQPDPDKRIRSPKEFWTMLERIKDPLG